MINIISSLLSGSLMLLTLILSKGNLQDSISSPVRIMFYNVENLFDTYNDTTKDDDDFLPEGTMRWTKTRYEKKIKALYKTIIAAGEWSPPEIVAFCEVENREVLENLIYGTYLSKYNYGIIHEESPDQRGIDVCMIYRRDCIKIIESRYWIPAGIKKESFTSRSILYTKLTYDYDTIHLFINHWPSRRGGVLHAEKLRNKIAMMIREKADSINEKASNGAKIIILGDLNCTPDDHEIKVLVSEDASDKFLINLSENQAAVGLGTYRYMGTWEMIDQVIVSEKLLSCKNGLYTDAKNLRIFRPDFLLTKDLKYPGFTTLSTYKGYLYQGGFSDHLPVLLNLNLRHQ